MQWTLPSADAAQVLAAPEWMAVAWFIILGGLLAMYAMLDGFDLGVGIVHFAAGRSATDRGNQIGAIGPVWDGNEVWLVVFGGALFAAFPLAYATIFSAFYLPLIFLLFFLIFRAATIELRHVFHRPAWHLLCDVGFSASSLLIAVTFGVAVGAMMQGLPLNEAGEFAPTPVEQYQAAGPIESVRVLLSPFSVSAGLLAGALCATHGAAYLCLKTSGAHAERCRNVAIGCWVAFLVCVLLVTALALRDVPSATRNMASAPWLWLVAVLGATATLWALVSMVKQRRVQAFAGTALMCLALVGLFMAALFPDIV
ncbi:MAG: cytochrome d ubiquinol oxidase subunit II, partial [Phycisphaerae bacterium]|nr:cytochrome d ubiquinol oxidase subunit II [Phycisphaerae bacterium]